MRIERGDTRNAHDDTFSARSELGYRQTNGIHSDPINISFLSTTIFFYKRLINSAARITKTHKGYSLYHDRSLSYDDEFVIMITRLDARRRTKQKRLL